MRDREEGGGRCRGQASGRGPAKATWASDEGHFPCAVLVGWKTRQPCVWKKINSPEHGGLFSGLAAIYSGDPGAGDQISEKDSLGVGLEERLTGDGDADRSGERPERHTLLQPQIPELSLTEATPLEICFPAPFVDGRVIPHAQDPCLLEREASRPRVWNSVVPSP